MLGKDKEEGQGRGSNSVAQGKRTVKKRCFWDSYQGVRVSWLWMLDLTFLRKVIPSQLSGSRRTVGVRGTDFPDPLEVRSVGCGLGVLRGGGWKSLLRCFFGFGWVVDPV